MTTYQARGFTIGQKKTCRKKQHVWIDDMNEMSNLICGKAAVGGKYNSTRDTNGGAKGSLYHYEQRKHDFKPGEVLRNFNGTDYKVMERYSVNNYLMMNMASGQFLAAMGLQYFSRHPHAGEYTKENEETGIEWGHGVYLSGSAVKGGEYPGRLPWGCH